MPRRICTRYFQAIFYFSIAAFLVVLSVSHASAQQITESLSSGLPPRYSFLHNADLFAGGFAQFTNPRVTHDGTAQQSASFAPGVLLRFHKSYRWWLGYDLNYGYTRFTERYDVIENPMPHVRVPVHFGSVPANAHEITAAYRIHGRSFYGLIPYAEGGIGETVFVPHNRYADIPGYGKNVESTVYMQHRLTGVYDVGLDAPHIITNHLGARFEYRNLVYESPTFKNWYFWTNNILMISQEAVGGMYFKF